MTIQRVQPSRADKVAQTTSQALRLESNILSGILPGHASVTDAVTRLQRERDLALRRIEELHDRYKKERKSKDDANYKMSQWHKDQHQNQLRIANNETAQYKMQFEQAMSDSKVEYQASPRRAWRGSRVRCRGDCTDAERST